MKDGEIVIKHFQFFQLLLEQLSIARAPVTYRCDHNQTSQNAHWVTEKKLQFCYKYLCGATLMSC
jgi:hypothetical protein